MDAMTGLRVPYRCVLLPRPFPREVGQFGERSPNNLLVDNGVGGPWDQLIILAHVGNHHRRIDVRAARHPVLPLHGQRCELVIGPLRYPANSRTIPVTVSAGIIGPIRRYFPIVEIRDTQRVFPFDLVILIRECGMIDARR